MTPDLVARLEALERDVAELRGKLANREPRPDALRAPVPVGDSIFTPEPTTQKNEP